MRTTVEDRTVVRGRRVDPIDRLPTNETGLEAQPTRFSAGMWAVMLFISSEAFFFGALFTTNFFLRSRIPSWEPVFGEKPSWHVDPILGIGLPTINTIELLVSSVTMQLAVNAIKRGDRQGLRNWLIPTLVLGVLFLVGQGYEYTKLGFLPRDGIFAGVFFTLTGFHGAHVTGGVILLTCIFIQSLRGIYTRHNFISVELAGLYWHFVDLVWIILFTVVYLI